MDVRTIKPALALDNLALTLGKMLAKQSLLLLWILELWSDCIHPALAQQTFFPSAVPLAVRTPTFNCWLATQNGTNPMVAWPTFWNVQHILGWSGLIKIDGLTYSWLGIPGVGNASKWLETEITPTRTILTVQAGPVLLNVTFLSPVEVQVGVQPSDWGRQSFPFSYLYLDGKASDGRSHSIQLYSDITAEWVSASLETRIQWNTSRTNHTNYHQVRSTSPTSVFADVAEDSVAYHVISSAEPKIVSIVGTAQALRPQFAAPGENFTLHSDLAGQIGTVQGGSGNFPVFAHALDLGTTDTISTVAWAVGVTRDPIATFAGLPHRAYYWSQYATIDDAIDAFMVDFTAAQTRAITLDQKILGDAANMSPDYVDLVSLATRQAMAGMEITVPMLPNGTLDLHNVRAFMKDVGNSQRVNPTEVIYAALPALMYLNSSITGALLEPLLEYQNSSEYTNPYAAPDLDSGNMLILVLAHARSSGDGSLIGRYYNLLTKWADYLGSNALIPVQQVPADGRDTGLGQNHGNLTNLALKGIIAIRAMAEISQVMGEATDAQKYEASAQTLIRSWIDLTSVSGLLDWSYGDNTFGLMYNLLADKLLQLDLIPESIYANESTILLNNAPQAPPFGFRLSNGTTSYTRSDWTLFSAAAAPDTSTRDLLISAVRKHASFNSTNTTFPTLYNVQTGLGPGAGIPQGLASPAQGAMFSILALSVANKTVVVPPPAETAGQGSSTNSHTGAIVGGIIGSLAAVLVIGGIIVLRRRRRQRDEAKELEILRPYQATSTVAPHKSAKSTLIPQPASSPEPQSGDQESSVSRGPENLRSEMERLREEVEQLRIQSILPLEAPPRYEGE
ncbi:hypothetical protein C8R45DRAFT_1099940 [Mycena sanguinolenta]|nr:hypothetical protein C8R45DRAFT_1099940 [Mycena sanguinolenta]